MTIIKYFKIAALVIVFNCLLNTNNNAQIINGYGLKLGLGIANQNWDYKNIVIKQEWDSFTGISARAYVDFLNSSLFNIEGEAGFSQKGIKYDLPITSTTNPDGTGELKKISNNLSYLSAALMGKIKLEMVLFTPYLLAGPQFNYLIDKKFEKGFDIIYDNFHKGTWGFTAGLGSTIKINSLNFLIEYRFERDLGNNFEFSTIDIKNYSHSFLVGVQF